MRKELKEIVRWLNKNYNQDSENYDIFCGSKPEVIRYNDHCAISLWSCGAIVCIYDILYFIAEDDGYWWINDEQNESSANYASQKVFSIGWAESFSNALKDLKEYVWKHGEPIYFSGTKTICHYMLTGDNE